MAVDTISVTVTSTSNQPKPATAMSSRNTTEYLIRFPPFPKVPDGVKIIPFKEFKERGIRVKPGGDDNETEIDACGVPTVMLASCHSTDWCKTETKRANQNGKGAAGRKRRKKRAGGINAGPTLMDWEEYWEDREPAYRVQGTYDP